MTRKWFLSHLYNLGMFYKNKISQMQQQKLEELEHIILVRTLGHYHI